MVSWLRGALSASYVSQHVQLIAISAMSASVAVTITVYGLYLPRIA